MRKLRRDDGEGTIRERPDREGFEGRIRLRVAGSKRLTRVSFYGQTRKDVLQQMRKASELSEKTRYVPNDRTTVAQYLHQWKGSGKQKLKAATIETRDLNVKRISEVIGHIRLTDLEKSDILKMDEHFTTAPRARTGRPLSGAARKQVWATLRKATREAVGLGKISFNPFTTMEREDTPKLDPTLERVITMHEREKLFSLNSGWSPIWKIFLATGLRSGELCALKWDAVDFANGQLHVRLNIRFKQPTKVDPRNYLLDTPKTSTSMRTIKMKPRLLELFQGVKEAQDALRDQAGSKWRDGNFVFTLSDGHPLLQHQVHAALKSELEAINVPPARVHDLRHTFGYDHVNNGTSIYLLSRMMGHKDAGFTLRVYGHYSEEAEELAAEVSDRLLKQAENMVAKVGRNA